jgi:hypothetical protein
MDKTYPFNLLIYLEEEKKITGDYPLGMPPNSAALF